MGSKAKDVAERIIWTAVQTFLGSMLASPFFDNLGLGWQDSLKIAGFAALGSLVKNILAINVGGESPQLGTETYEYAPNQP